MKLKDFKQAITSTQKVHIDNRRNHIDVSSYLKEESKIGRKFSPKLALTMASFLLIFAFAYLLNLRYTPVSTLTIDLNPSIKVDINAFNRVVAIEGINSDGMEFVNDLDYNFKTIEDLLEEIKETGIESGYFTDSEAYLLVGIYGSDYEKEAEIDTLLTESTYFKFLTIAQHDEDNTLSLTNDYTRDYSSVFFSKNETDVENAMTSDFDTLEPGSQDEITANILLEYQLSEAKLSVINSILERNPYDSIDVEWLLSLSIEELILEYQS